MFSYHHWVFGLHLDPSERVCYFSGANHGCQPLIEFEKGYPIDAI